MFQVSCSPSSALVMDFACKLGILGGVIVQDSPRLRYTLRVPPNISVLSNDLKGMSRLSKFKWTINPLVSSSYALSALSAFTLNGVSAIANKTNNSDSNFFIFLSFGSLRAPFFFCKIKNKVAKIQKESF